MKSEIRNLKLLVKTFGCQMNKLDSALICSALKRAGFDLTENVKAADVVLLNTCSVRQHAEDRVLSHLGHLKHIKETRPDIIVAVIGCMAQRLGAELLARDEVDIVCGPAQIPHINQLITKALETKQKTLTITKKIRTAPPQNDDLENFESLYDTAEREIPGQAFVRVMRGCDKFCSYCIVPYVRGPEISRPPKAIIEQIKRLSGQGVKQVTLLGQTVNSYKYTAGEKTYCLADLLEMASQVDGIEWLRFITSYPQQEFFGRIIQAMASLPRLCKYLHIPAQSGSDKILKKMNRKYTADDYLALLETARDIVPDIAIASDFIVGFPGETDDDFQQTVELVQKARYKNCFIFKYSPRPGTIGEKKLKDDVPQDIKKQRNIKLLAVQEKISGELAERFLGKTVTVLVEGLSKKPHLNAPESNDNPQLLGRTAQDRIVVFNAPESLAGQFANVIITRTSPFTLFGKLKN